MSEQKFIPFTAMANKMNVKPITISECLYKSIEDEVDFYGSGVLEKVQERIDGVIKAVLAIASVLPPDIAVKLAEEIGYREHKGMK